MPETSEAVRLATEVRRRAERFASLRAAQRALSRSVHPSELAQANEQGRELLIQLQALSAAASAGQGVDVEAAASAGQGVDVEALRRVDGMLDENSRRMREILDRIEIAQLRSTVPPLLAEHADEVRGLVDVLAEGDVESNDNLRKLEYLVTMLCSEERKDRRVVTQEPADVSATLREVTRRRLADPEEQVSAAERRLGDAITQLLRGSSDVGSVRDEMRRFKEELGGRLLHPRIFASAVAYNVAMSNQVAGLVVGSRSIDRLAADLLSAADADAAATPSAPGAQAETSANVLGSPAFERLLGAFRARVAGSTPASAGDDPAARIAAACPLDALVPMEVEAFDADENDQVGRLMRTAVVLGLVSRHLAALDAPLRELGIDPELLATEGVQEIMDAMTAVARKRFAGSDYDAAFRISEIKTRNLAGLSSRREQAPRGGVEGEAASARRPQGSEAAPPAQQGALANLAFSARRLLLAALAAGLVLAAVLWLPSGWSGAIYSNDELARISPFLDSGYRDEREGRPVFVGRLHATWDHLGTQERSEVATRVGRTFEALGVPDVVLLDRRRRPQVDWRAGQLVQLAPKPGEAPVR